MAGCRSSRPRVGADIPAGEAHVALAFRPHALRLADGADAAALVFEAEIASTEFLGEFVRHELVVGALRAVADLPHARHATVLAPGARARFAVPVDELLVLADTPAAAPSGGSPLGYDAGFPGDMRAGPRTSEPP